MTNKLWTKCKADALTARFRLRDIYGVTVAEGNYDEIVVALQKWYSDLEDGIEYEPNVPGNDAAELLYAIRDDSYGGEAGKVLSGPEGGCCAEYYFEEA